MKLFRWFKPKPYLPGPTFEKCTFGDKYVEWVCICQHKNKQEHERAKELYYRGK